MKLRPTCFHSGQMNEIWREDRDSCATCFHQSSKKLTAAHTHTHKSCLTLIPVCPRTNRLWWMERPRDIFFWGGGVEYVNDDNTILYYIFKKEIEKNIRRLFFFQTNRPNFVSFSWSRSEFGRRWVTYTNDNRSWKRRQEFCASAFERSRELWVRRGIIGVKKKKKTKKRKSVSHVHRGQIKVDKRKKMRCGKIGFSFGNVKSRK
jgi:hypothetical protein